MGLQHSSVREAIRHALISRIITLLEMNVTHVMFYKVIINNFMHALYLFNIHDIYDGNDL